MKIIVAPDSFKGCLSARDAASVLAATLRECLPDANVVECPLADGGEGTLDVLVRALNGTCFEAVVSDPLGRPVRASYGICGDLAIIEVAQACGLHLLAPTERNPLLASSRGVGELLCAAASHGCRRMVIGLGGSATCDGGAGMLAGLSEGCALSGRELQDSLSGISISVLCDVDNPFLGPSGAARVFGPQKGASPADVEILEKRMASMAQRMLAQTGLDVSNLPGAGAAGGLGGALAACFGGKLVRGIDTILDLIGFDKLSDGADWVITGEGKSDRQTLSGKAPYGVLQRAGTIPVALLSGRIEHPETLRTAGFTYLDAITPIDLPDSEATRPDTARAYLTLAARRFANTIAT